MQAETAADLSIDAGQANGSAGLMVSGFTKPQKAILMPLSLNEMAAEKANTGVLSRLNPAPQALFSSNGKLNT